MVNLNIPNPPPELTYSQFEDFRNRAILRANGISLSEVELIAALTKERNVLQAAAAHTLGSLSSRAATPILKDLLSSSEDLVKVEAAFALARLGVREGKDALVQCLSYSVDAYLFPAIAAGYLAQLDDPQGFNTIINCLNVDIPPIRVLACKQLYFFVRFQGRPNKGRDSIDVYGLFDRALKDHGTDIQWQALVQLREIRSPESKSLLERYVETAQDERLCDIAREILASFA